MVKSDVIDSALVDVTHGGVQKTNKQTNKGKRESQITRCTGCAGQCLIASCGRREL